RATAWPRVSATATATARWTPWPPRCCWKAGWPRIPQLPDSRTRGPPMTLPNPAELLPRMASDLQAHLKARNIDEPRYIGIRTGGVWVAQALLEQLGEKAPMGTLDVSFYRDDFTQSG